ncbi:MAG: VWA domain-containing protein [Planctomycetes bacterium]|nr:VWA domain-containing protein [Planctomycetota bacterium]
MKNIICARFSLAILLLACISLTNAGNSPLSIAAETMPEPGNLMAIGKDGKPAGLCPLKHTYVVAEISGFVSHVTVKQIFENPFKEKIEAIYTFPLSANGAVYEMLMQVGNKTVRGEIKRREEARRIYEEARDQGKVASLLDQERPNIFTQSVANIVPGAQVEITIKYVELIPYADGKFTFSFPMVVGPRFMPGEAVGHEGTGWAPDTTKVPDASKISPPVTPPDTRAGHDIDLAVNIDAGMAIQDMVSKLHDVNITKSNGNQKAGITLKNKQTIPNKDFVLEYSVAQDDVKSGFLVHKDGDTGYLTLMLIPPKKVKPEQVAPKEMIFVIDRSGSQSGLPIEKAKETMNFILKNMNPEDTFNVIDFSNQVHVMFETPQKNTPEIVKKAGEYIATLTGNGGTWMAPAVEKACSTPADANRLRIVTFMTDGYVGNDFEIIDLVKKLRGNSRWFPFGTGNSVNRFLLDNMARMGGGEVEYILLNDPGEEVAKKFYSRISTPVLTDIKVDFGGLAVEEVFPKEVSDLWDQKPLYYKAKYTKAGKGVITLKGFYGGKPYEQKLEVTLPETELANKALSPVWARAKVDMLMDQNLTGVQRGAIENELKEEIVKVALEHRIMTQYTSFVAVEETVITEGGKPKTITVPVEMPEGVSYEGVFGEYSEKQNKAVGIGGGQFRGSFGGAKTKAPDQPAQAPPAPMTPPSSANSAEDEESDSFDSISSPLKSQEELKKMTPEELKKYYVELRTANELIGLAEKVAKEGKDGNLKLEKFEVTGGIVTVQVWLNDNSDSAIDALKTLGLEVIFNSSTAKMVIGKIDVKKLEGLAQSEKVKLIEPAKI